MGRVDPQILPHLSALLAEISPLSIAALSAVLLALTVCALVLRRSRKGFFAGVGRLFLVVVTAALSGSLIWGVAAARDRDAQRAALKLRAGELAAQALAPGSSLACLDVLAGDTVQAACERAVFATPATVASAVAYVAAQYALLADMTAFSRRSGGTDIGDDLVPLRRELEADPFGFLAHVLVRRDGCTSERCQAFALLDDPSHVRTNIIAQTLQHYVDHYRDVWARTADAPVVGAADISPTGTADPGKRKASVDIDFPSAASIPPISIMNPEPKTTPAIAEAVRKREKPKDSVDPVWRPAAPVQATQ